MTTNQTDIFSLFGIEDEYTAKKREEEELKKATLEKATKNKSIGNPVEKVDFSIDKNTTIRYFGTDLSITDYFTVDELTDKTNIIKAEDVRKRLEVDFPELVSNLTEIVYLKKKNLVLPILQAKKKGSPVNINELRKDHKRIPFSLLQEFITIAKYFSDTYGSEVHGDIYLDLEHDIFFLDLPKQITSPYWVEVSETAEETALKLLELRYVKVMEIHSHHILNCHPSSQDDESERAPIFYAIIGNINSYFPSISVRTFQKETQSHLNLEPSAIFEYPFSVPLTLPLQLDNVEVER
jgi:hypothetical protein